MNREIMQRYGSELEFIGLIEREGTGITPAKDVPNMIEACQGDLFTLNCLSLTHCTFIASHFNSFVVRLKNPPPEKYYKSKDPSPATKTG